MNSSSTDNRAFTPLPYTIIVNMVAVAGMFGNIMVILMTLHENLSGFSYSTYLRVIAISDSLVLLHTAAEEIMAVTNVFSAFMNYSEHLQRLWSLSRMTSTVASPFLLVALSLDRCIAIALPFYKTRFCSKKIATIVCTGVVVVALGLSVTFGMVEETMTRSPFLDQMPVAPRNVSSPKKQDTFRSWEEQGKFILDAEQGNSMFSGSHKGSLEPSNFSLTIEPGNSSFSGKGIHKESSLKPGNRNHDIDPNDSSFEGEEVDASRDVDPSNINIPTVPRNSAISGQPSNSSHHVEQDNSSIQIVPGNFNLSREPSNLGLNEQPGKFILSTEPGGFSQERNSINFNLHSDINEVSDENQMKKDEDSLFNQTLYIKIVLHAILPCFLLAILNSIVVVKIRQSLAFRKKSVVKDGNWSSLRASIPLIVVTVLAFLTLFPVVTTEIIELIKMESVDEMKSFGITWFACNSLYLLNFAQNFYILIASSRMYRTAAKDVMSCCFRPSTSCQNKENKQKIDRDCRRECPEMEKHRGD